MAPRTIAGRYELTSRIGSGGMGTVWQARDRLLDRPVAVKLLHEGLAEDTAFGERFRREARIAASLPHENVVAVYDTGEDDQTPYIVMELVEGASLHALLKDGPLPVDEAVRITRSVLAALAHAHDRGLVHRDMKPANVLIEAGSNHVKVADFGIAKGLEDTSGLTRTGSLIGTAAYLSPEQISGREATPASDLYAVGCLLYEALAGDPPFTGTTAVAVAMRHLNDPVPPLRAKRPDVPAQIDAVVMRALDKRPEGRFSNAEEMDNAITGAAPVTAPMTAPVAPAAPIATAPLRAQRVRTARRPRTPSILGVVTALLIVAAAVWLVLTYIQNREPAGSGELRAPVSTPQPTPRPPTATPKPTPSPTTAATAQPQPDFPNLPGFDND